MKLMKFIAVFLCATMIIMAFAACGDNGDDTTADTTGNVTEGASDSGSQSATTGTMSTETESATETGGISIVETTADSQTAADTPAQTEKQPEPADSKPAADTDNKPADTTNKPADTTNATTQKPADDQPVEATLTFDGMKCSPSKSGVVSISDDHAFLISKAGTYTLKGNLSNGQIRVAVSKTEQVTLVLAGFSAKSSKTAPLYIVSADKVTIQLAAGTVNTFEDAETYVFANPADDKPNACIYSSDDLTIKGEGALVVKGNYNNGIGGKNDVRIRGGNVTVSAPNNIIKGNDSVTISGAKVTLSGGEDAIKTDNIDEVGKGYILIEDGAEISIDCLDDALQADQSLIVYSTVRISGTCGGDVINCAGALDVAEGVITVTSTSAPATAA